MLKRGKETRFFSRYATLFATALVSPWLATSLSGQENSSAPPVYYSQTAVEGAPEGGAPVAKPSPAIADILKLLQAKVDSGVIKAYVDNSSIPYQPTAQELILLKQAGATPEVLKALIDHGATLQAQVAQYAMPPANYAVTAAPRAAGASTAPQDYSQASYAQGGEDTSSTYTVPSYTYSYAVYPTTSYGYGGSCWPWYVSWSWPWWSSAYCSSYGYWGGCYPYGYYAGYYPYGYCRGYYPYGYYHGYYPYGYKHGYYPYNGYKGYYAYGGKTGYYPYGGQKGYYPNSGNVVRTYPHATGSRYFNNSGVHSGVSSGIHSGVHWRQPARQVPTAARPVSYRANSTAFRSHPTAGFSGGRSAGFRAPTASFSRPASFNHAVSGGFSRPAGGSFGHVGGGMMHGGGGGGWRH
jgi:hypothetical protein